MPQLKTQGKILSTTNSPFSLTYLCQVSEKKRKKKGKKNSQFLLKKRSAHDIFANESLMYSCDLKIQGSEASQNNGVGLHHLLLVDANLHIPPCYPCSAAPSPKIGICYGTKGDNLPTPTEVIALLKGCSIKKLKLYDTNPQLLEAVEAIIKPPDVLEIAVTVRNEELANLAASLDAAIDWVGKNILPFRTPVLSFQDILVGNEVVPGENARKIIGAMQNLHAALQHANMTECTVSTVISYSVLQNTFPPSQATFTSEANEIMKELVAFQLSLPSGIRSYMYINIYPYFSYAADPEHISLDHALFQGKAPMFKDGNLTYWNLFDAMYDAFLWALEKIGGTKLTVMVGESGWPSGGNGASTTPELASAYLNNLYNHISEAGTPKLPQNVSFEGAYVYALYNENLKPAGVEQHFGLFYPSMKPVYTPNPMCQIN